MLMTQLHAIRPRRGLAFLRPWIARLLTVLLIPTLTGCGNGGSDSGEPQLIIELEGVSYLWKVRKVVLDSANGGLHALGDINGDGYSDILVAASRQGRGASVDRGWIEAWSSRDGTLLWQQSGKGVKEAKADGNEDPYQFEDVTLVGDLNGDGIRDIYCREAWSSRTAILLSGRDGSRIGRYPIERTDYLRRPVRWQDVDGDGSVDLVFRRYDKLRPLALQALSGVDFSLIPDFDHIRPDARDPSAAWLLPQFRDVNADGISDCVVRRGLRSSSTDPKYSYEYAVLSGKDFSAIRRFQTSRPRVGGDTVHAQARDLNGDTVEDILMASVTGAGQNNQTSFLRAISGSDGDVVWNVLGTQLPGGRKSLLVDAQTGRKTELGPDVEFGAPVIATPDLNGDNVPEVVTVAGTPDGKRTRQAVLIFSGSDGNHLAILDVPEERGALKIGRTQIILLDSVTAEGRSGVAVAGRTPLGNTMLAIFVLPDLR